MLLILSPRIYWQFKEGTQLDVLIIDKTVANKEYREHQGLFWFLTNEKIKKSTGELYERDMDYYGYDIYAGKPMESYKYTADKDLIYVADTYGVFSGDLESFSKGDRSQLLYGGMELAEWQEIMKTKSDTNILITEFNSFASPTSEAVRKVMERSLYVEWSDWIGRYFLDLNSDEVPPWLKQNYEQQYNKEWSFKKGGLVFVHSSDQVVIIDESQLNSRVQFQMTAEGKDRFKGIGNTDYSYWFDIITPMDGAIALAEYEIDVSEVAKNELTKNGIPTVFPAITYHEGENIYYFSGDYADNSKDSLMKWQWSSKLMKVFSIEDSNFTWAVYMPLMRQIIEQLK